MLSCVIIIALSAVSGQYCDCDEGWTYGPEGDCSVCAAGYGPEGECADENPNPWCIFDKCNNGACIEDEDRCECYENFAGDYCDECDDEHSGYPTCTSPLCDAQDICAGNGVCAAPPIPCGPSLGCDPLTESCYKYSYPNLSGSGSGSSSGYGSGSGSGSVSVAFALELYRCVLQSETGCGSETCAWNAHCAEDSITGVFDLCCEDGDEQCFPLDSEETVVGDGACCKPYEICCDGACCSSLETCVKKPEPEHGWVDVNGEETGDTEKYCADDGLTPASALRVAYLPLIFILMGFGNLVMLLVRPSTDLDVGSNKGLLIPALLIFVSSLIMLFSPGWGHAVLLMFLSLCVISHAGSGSNKIGYILLFEVVVLLVVLGGSDVSSMVVQSNDVNFPQLSSSYSGQSVANLNQARSDCALYYNYFWTDPDGKAWDHDDINDYHGYCHFQWMAAVDFFSAVSVCSLIILVAFTGERYASNGGGASSMDHMKDGIALDTMNANKVA